MHKGLSLTTATLALLFCSVVFIPTFAASATPRRIEITAKKFSFLPSEITLQKGQPVDLVMKSSDVAHGIRFRDLNVDIKVNKGATADVRFTPEKIGTFVGHCSVFCGSGHGRMALTIHVVE